MNFDKLNEMIKYIEDNLDNEIDFTKISQITGTNTFIIERIFSFLTGMTLNEYIKKRRLSKAYEDIKNTNAKIIDIAFKYQYNSASSFNRAFKQLFNISPTECKKSTSTYQIIPMEYFDYERKEYNFEYHIKNMTAKELYCYHISSNNYNDFHLKIAKLYKDLKKTDQYKNLNESGMYGIFTKTKDTFNYYLGSTKYQDNLTKYNLKENQYIEFKLLSKEQSDITNLEHKINKQWLPSTNYHIDENIKIELYKDDYCYIYLPLH